MTEASEQLESSGNLGFFLKLAVLWVANQVEVFLLGNQFLISHDKLILISKALTNLIRVTYCWKANFLNFQTTVIVSSTSQLLLIKLTCFNSAYHFVEK